MVFVVGSSDQTQKVILNSRTRTSGLINNPIFTLFQPITTPYDSIGLVNLEGCIVNAPSLYSPGVLTNPRNWFYNTATPDVNAYPNLYLMFELFKKINLNNPEMVGMFFTNLAYNIPGCYFTLPYYVNVNGIFNTFYYDATQQAYHVGHTFAAATANPQLTALQLAGILSDYLRNLNTYSFSITSRVAGVRYGFAGEWVKLFGQTPLYKDQGQSYYCDTETSWVVTLNTTGYRYLNLHTNFARAVYTSNDEGVIAPTDVLWCIPIRSDPGETTYYDNVNTAGKIPYNTNIIETIEVYFTDEWGDWVTDMEEFTITITFDFSPKQQLTQAPTIKQARRNLAENAGL